MNESRRIWGMRALALAVAVAIWVVISLEDRDSLSEKKLEASVSYTKPQSLTILNRIEKVSVVVAGPSEAVRLLAPYMVDVQVVITQTEPGTVELPLTPDNVRLPPGDGLSVVSIEPNVPPLELDREVSLTLPLEVSFTGEPAAGAQVLHDEVAIVPSQAVVLGPSSVLQGVDHLELTAINLNGHAISFEESATVITPDPSVQVVQNPRVVVRVPMDLGTAAGGSFP